MIPCGPSRNCVCLEAMAEGVPCVAHNYPTTQVLLGPHGITGDLLQPGGLSRLLESVGDDELAEEKRRARRKFVYDGFSWDVLRPRYLEMIRACSSA